MGKGKALITSQFKRIGRDSMLIILMVYPFILTIIGRYLVPIIQQATLTASFNLADHYHSLMVFFVVMNPVLYGDIIGLMLIDEREDNTLSAIRVLPIQMSHYILGKSALFIVLSTISGMLVTWLINLFYVPLIASLFINLVAALGVLFGMLLVNYLATNKVEGFAAMKGTGFILIIPVVALYIPQPYSYLGALAPGYWPAMAIASYYAGFTPPLEPWVYLALGGAYIGILCFFLYRKTMAKMLA